MGVLLVNQFSTVPQISGPLAPCGAPLLHPLRTPKLLTPPPKLKPYQGEVPKSCLRPSCAKGTPAFIYVHVRVCVGLVYVCMCVQARAHAGVWQGRALRPGAGLSAESGSRTYQAARGRAPQCRTSGQPLRTAAGPRITEQADDPGIA